MNKIRCGRGYDFKESITKSNPNSMDNEIVSKNDEGSE
jgi:hypothetical protein